jgi:hypothetical protein
MFFSQPSQTDQTCRCMAGGGALLSFLMCCRAGGTAPATAAATAVPADMHHPMLRLRQQMRTAHCSHQHSPLPMAALPCFINGINSRGRAETAAPMAAPVNLIFVVAGAGCGSMGRYLPQYFTGLEGESGATRISVLQKRHISDQASGDECSEAFIRADHLSQWQADQRAFIQAQLRQFKQQGMQPRRDFVGHF